METIRIIQEVLTKYTQPLLGGMTAWEVASILEQELAKAGWELICPTHCKVCAKQFNRQANDLPDMCPKCDETTSGDMDDKYDVEERAQVEE